MTVWMGRRSRLGMARSVGLACLERLEPGSLGWSDKNNPFIREIRVFPSYTFDCNGNLLASGVMANTFDAANRLVSSSREGVTVQPVYNKGEQPGSTEGAD